jgi:hypothetical protein
MGIPSFRGEAVVGAARAGWVQTPHGAVPTRPYTPLTGRDREGCAGGALLAILFGKIGPGGPPCFR